ncbi:uncharacterized protein DSM5745_06925 [Aspergillus mulundensis]|uniref:Uncharacterized protein n=1 Tax=Aspergillus mulundensis TaxID=1810919 RepID=A0A3D8RJN5_9EURO|nr:hypothetical protein DSM5745_06925 [Aspergillus mulundensis]RDW74263.1 hypothetical protein DSM5745_06925 [Aspergillus mulundensis]
MAEAVPIPIVLCGRRVEVGKVVSELLLPEYEVIHFCATPVAAESELPLLLWGKDPSHRRSQRDRHAQLHPATTWCGIWPWLRPRFRQEAPVHVHVPAPAEPPPPGYAQATEDVVKRVLAIWREDGGGCFPGILGLNLRDWTKSGATSILAAVQGLF